MSEKQQESSWWVVVPIVALVSLAWVLSWMVGCLEHRTEIEFEKWKIERSSEAKP